MATDASCWWVKAVGSELKVGGWWDGVELDKLAGVVRMTGVKFDVVKEIRREKGKFKMYEKRKRNE